MKTRQTTISDLVADPANVRSHDAKNIKAIRDSLEKFGQQKPIVVNADGVVVAGNGTLAAASDLGWDEIATVCTDLAGPAATAYAIADNRTAELAGWDEDALAEQLAAIKITDEELAAATGFDAKAIEELIGKPEVVEDEVPEPPADPITKPGDLWLLGAYFECEDCAKRFTYEEGNAMGGECDCE